MRTPAKVKVSSIRKFFEDKVIKPRYKITSKSRTARTARSGRKMEFGSSSEDEMSSPPKDQRKGKTGSSQQETMETDSTRKRPRDEQQEEDNQSNPDKVSKDQAEEQLKDKIIDLSEIQVILEKGGAGHLFEAVRGKIFELLDKVLVKQAKVMKQIIDETRRRDKELDRCGRSILIHNADKLVTEDYDEKVNYSLAEKVTEALHTMCRCMITIVEAFPMGKMVEGKPTTSICVVLGSSRQKSVVYRTIAAHVRNRTPIGQVIQQVSLREVFPKNLIPEAQRLVQQGLGMKREGQIHSFKVSAVGAGVIPVLFIRVRDDFGNLGPWRVYQQPRSETGGQSATGQTADGDWQVVKRSGHREAPEQGERQATGGKEVEAIRLKDLLTDPYLPGIDPDLQDSFIRRGMNRAQQKKK